MPEPEYQYYANGKEYSSVDEAVNDYINEVNPGVNPAKLDKILKAINLDILGNLTGGVTYLKESVEPLSQSTVKRKHHSTPFLDQGILFNSVKDTMLSELHGVVFIDGKRAAIASMLNYGTNRMPQREFFGLSDEVLQIVDVILIED